MSTILWNIVKANDNDITWPSNHFINMTRWYFLSKHESVATSMNVCTCAIRHKHNFNSYVRGGFWAKPGGLAIHMQVHFGEPRNFKKFSPVSFMQLLYMGESLADPVISYKKRYSYIVKCIPERRKTIAEKVQSSVTCPRGRLVHLSVWTHRQITCLSFLSKKCHVTAIKVSCYTTV